MSKYRRPLLVIASAVAISTLMSACIVVPARGYYRHRHYGQVTPAETAPQAPAPAPTSQG
ncbi:MAG TPA: hypothetical protein VFY73_24450 [Ideonella sp.]|jgi:hypothetical protein|uniref:hypothetical protein n=1 Tax=Ideonella sp. TaxID=1929293 RepID=UPI002E2F710D|nr:hypothetical protein [Ideonella sp.]HEX5687179.1 hypothetical protein [Ideonella sp.]